MITCSLKINENIDNLHKIFLSEKLSSDRASCKIQKKSSLVFDIQAKDPVSMRAFLNSILKIIETYNRAQAVK